MSGRSNTGDAKDTRIVAQNAGSSAAIIYAALLANSGETSFNKSDYDDIRDHVFSGSLSLGQDSVVTTVFPTATEVANGNSSSGEDNGDTELKFGMYRGKTIAEVYDSGADGVGWLKWAAEKSNNEFMKRRIADFLESVSASA